MLPQSAVRDEQAPQGLGMTSWAPGEIDIVAPCPNSFLAFQGDLLHGVLPQPEREGPEGRRLTLLINWWQRTPRAPCCSPLPPELLTALTASEPQTPPDEWGLGDGSVPERCEPEAMREVDAMEVECEELEILAPPHLGETLLRLCCDCCALARPHLFQLAAGEVSGHSFHVQGWEWGRCSAAGCRRRGAWLSSAAPRSCATPTPSEPPMSHGQNRHPTTHDESAALKACPSPWRQSWLGRR